MLVESIAILLILFIIVVVFLRARRKDDTIAILPLLLVPLVHTILELLRDAFPAVISTNVRAFADVLALAASVTVMGVLSGKMKSRKVKAAYLLLSVGFSAILTLIYLSHIYLPG